MKISETLKQERTIMAVKDADSLERALACDKNVIFLLKSDISSAKDTVKKCKQKGKAVFIHLDLMEGIGKDEAAVKFIANSICPDGIISTKTNIIKLASSYGLQTVLRVFLIDSQGMESAFNTLKKIDADAIEIMPGIMPEVIAKVSSHCKTLIAGGMVSEKRHVIDAINNGAIAVSTSNEILWKTAFDL